MTVTDGTPAWAHDLEAWSKLPAQSVIWDQVDGFVEALHKLAASKLIEREAGRTALRAALERLRLEFSSEFEYFESRPDLWQAESIDRQKALEVASLVDELHAGLESRKSLQGQPSAHYQEARRLRDEINDIEDVIFKRIAVITSIFGPTSSPVDRPESSTIATQPVDSLPAPKPVMPAPEPVMPAPKPDIPTPKPVIPVIAVDVKTAVAEDTIHAVLHSDTGKYSPLTRDQEKQILADGSGVGAIFASGALGFEHLPEAVSHLVTTSLGSRGAYGAIPPTIQSQQDIIHWIGEFVESHSAAERLFVCQPVAIPSADVAGRMQGALQYCKEHSETTIRVIFYLAPGGVWAWLTALREKREAVGAQLYPVMPLNTWSSEAIRDRLAARGKLHDAVILSKVLETTGGWSWCLDKLFEMSGKNPNIAPALEKMSQGLFRGGDLHDELVMRIGVRPETPAHTVLNFIRSEGEVPVELITSDMVGEKTTPEECIAAVEFLQMLRCTELNDGMMRLNPFLAHVLTPA